MPCIFVYFLFSTVYSSSTWLFLSSQNYHLISISTPLKHSWVYVSHVLLKEDSKYKSRTRNNKFKSFRVAWKIPKYKTHTYTLCSISSLYGRMHISVKNKKRIFRANVYKFSISILSPPPYLYEEKSYYWCSNSCYRWNSARRNKYLRCKQCICKKCMTPWIPRAELTTKHDKFSFWESLHRSSHSASGSYGQT